MVVVVVMVVLLGHGLRCAMCMATKYDAARVTETNLQVPSQLGIRLPPGDSGTAALDDQELLAIESDSKKSKRSKNDATKRHFYQPLKTVTQLESCLANLPRTRAR